MSEPARILAALDAGPLHYRAVSRATGIHVIRVCGHLGALIQRGAVARDGDRYSISARLLPASPLVAHVHGSGRVSSEVAP